MRQQSGKCWHFLGSLATGMMAQGNMPDASLAHNHCELHYPNLASGRSLPRLTQTGVCVCTGALYSNTPGVLRSYSTVHTWVVPANLSLLPVFSPLLRAWHPACHTIWDLFIHFPSNTGRAVVPSALIYLASMAMSTWAMSLADL